MSELDIPFNRVDIVGNEFEYMKEVVQNGHISGDGKFTKACNQLFERKLGLEKSLLTTSCTHALEMAAILLDLQPGDEFIVPAFTFVSTANAFALRGATPVFADIRPDTLNIDERQLEDLITEKTKAIVIVHYAGVGCEMDKILEIAARRGIPVVEDNAHGLFGKYRGKYLGTFAPLATQSFHETKNFSCGEGGALFINTPELVERAEIIREKGTNRANFFRGQVDKYTWVDIGSSYLPSDILAAFLYAQLERRNEIQMRRKRIWETYYSGLADWSEEHAVSRPFVPEYCEQTFHMFYLLTPSLEFRTELIRHLKQFGILAVFHYQPLNLSQKGMEISPPANCPVTEQVGDRLLRLPMYFSLDPGLQAAVMEAIHAFRP